MVQRGLWLDSALDEMRRDLEEDRFTSAIGHFREALGLSRGLPQLKARVDEHAEIHSEELLPRNWRIAEALLQEAAATEPRLTPDPELLEKLNQARQDELVCAAIYKADRLAQDGKTAEARDHLSALLAAHPKEVRIRDRIHSLDYPDGAVTEDMEVTPVAVPVQPMATSSQAPEEMEMNVAPTASVPPEPLRPWQTKVLISSSAWNATKDLAAVVATAVMLGLAGLLVWRHFAEQPVHQARVRPLQPGLREPAKPAQQVAPAADSNALFQDVPVPPSDQESILKAVRLYSENHGTQIGEDIVDEVDVQGKQAKVRLRSRETSGGRNLIFTLSRESDGWRVRKVE
jgi:hypothetical protein